MILFYIRGVSFVAKYMYGTSSSSSLVSIPNEVKNDLWLSSTSNAEKSVRLYVVFHGSDLSPSSSDKKLTSCFLQTNVSLLDALSAGTMTKF